MKEVCSVCNRSLEGRYCMAFEYVNGKPVCYGCLSAESSETDATEYTPAEETGILEAFNKWTGR